MLLGVGTTAKSLASLKGGHFGTNWYRGTMFLTPNTSFGGRNGKTWYPTFNRADFLSGN
jgi:hypothetical protein